MRFYPQDIIDVLPELFNMTKYGNKEFIEGEAVKKLVSKYNIPDDKFEKFYRAVTGQTPTDFPKQYK